MKRLSDAVAPVAGRSFERKYIALGRIVKSWPEVIGAHMAERAQPVKIHYRKAKVKGEKSRAILEIAVSSADSTALHYQKDLILERLNHLFGDQWISDIKFTPSPVSRPQRRAPITKKPLTAGDKKSLSLLLEKIEDPDILARLSSLGEHVMIHDKDSTKP